MKNKLLFFAAMLFITGTSFATVYRVSVGAGSGFSFSPSSGVTMHPGDTIKWVWATGSHTTTSTTIPSGAATWTQDINNATSSDTTFMYVPTVVGTYNYQCNFHVSMGMTGTFTVVSSTGIPQVNAKKPIFKMYPNPAAGTVHIQFNHPAQPVTLTLIDIAGKEVFKKTYKTLNETDINLNDIPNGTYVLGAVQGSNTYRQQLIVAH